MKSIELKQLMLDSSDKLTGGWLLLTLLHLLCLAYCIIWKQEYVVFLLHILCFKLKCKNKPYLYLKTKK